MALPTRPRSRRGAAGPGVATGAYLVILLVALVQVVTARPAQTLTVPVLAYALALGSYLLVLRAGPREPRVEGAERWSAGLALAGVLLASWLLAGFLRALPEGLASAAGYYRVKLLVTSPLGDHNTAAGLLLVPLVAAVTLAVRRAGWWVAVAVVTAGFVAALSRGAALVLLAVAVAGGWLASSRRVAVALGAVALLAAGAVIGLAAVLGAAPPPGAAAGVGPFGTSVLGRVDLAVRGAELTAAEPLLGVGFGSFATHAADLPVPNDHAHQLVAHAGAEGGLFTALAVLVVSVLLLLRSGRLPRTPLRDAALLGGGGLLVHAQIEILGGLPAYEVLVAVLLGLATVAGARDGSAADGGVRPPG
jgi:O-antigen ligase